MRFLIKDDEEADLILVEADAILLEQPVPMPELLGAGVSPTNNAEAHSVEGMAPCEGSGEELRKRECLCQGPSPGVPHRRKN